MAPKAAPKRAAGNGAAKAVAQKAGKELVVLSRPDESEESDGSWNSEDEEVRQAVASGLLSMDAPDAPKRQKINDKVALQAKLDEIKLPEDPKEFPWVEKLDITSAAPIVIENVNDDFKREMAFYEQALAAVKEARIRLDAAGVPFKRPDDYFAEMLKTDEHMKKVREKLATQKESIEKSLEAKKQRELKKFGKKVQTKVLEDRAKQKRDDMEAIKKFRKDRTKDSKPEFLDGGDDFGVGVDEEGGGRKRKASDAPEQRNAKRARKDKKYGFGGSKKHAKSNTAESAADDSGFNPFRNKQLPKGFQGAGRPHKAGGKPGGRPGAKGGKAKRPGKAARQKMKARK